MLDGPEQASAFSAKVDSTVEVSGRAKSKGDQLDGRSDVEKWVRNVRCYTFSKSFRFRKHKFDIIDKLVAYFQKHFYNIILEASTRAVAAMILPRL